jgi:predicted nucleic acid-binding protein
MGAAVSRRVVLDTHTLVSALLFQQGRLAWLKTARCASLSRLLFRFL